MTGDSDRCKTGAFATNGGIIRPINADSYSEISLVAQRMRQTLVEVLGEEQGTSLYTMDWLIQRVRWHLDSDQTTASVFIAEDAHGTIVGHTIVRKDLNYLQKEIGLFSTTFVEPEFRRAGVASNLLQEGENWILENGLSDSETYTAESNVKLIQLFRRNGYAQSPGENQMVILRKSFDVSA